MTYMLDEIILARMMTNLHLEFKRALHCHDEGYESDNDYGLPPQIIKPIHVYSIFTTEAFFNLADFTTAPHLISPFTPKHPRTLPFWEGACWHLTFDEMSPPMPETDWGWWRTPSNCRPGYPGVGWKTGTKQLGISLHPSKFIGWLPQLHPHSPP